MLGHFSTAHKGMFWFWQFIVIDKKKSLILILFFKSGNPFKKKK
jgi:hypothetical protein